MARCYLLVNVQEIRIQPNFCVKQGDFSLFLGHPVCMHLKSPINASLYIHPSNISFKSFKIWKIMMQMQGAGVYDMKLHILKYVNFSYQTAEPSYI